jgi:hypothetical protein
MPMRIMLALLSVAMRTIRHASPHQVSGSSFAALPSNGLSMPVLVMPEGLSGFCLWFVIRSGTFTSSAYIKVDRARLCEHALRSRQSFGG